MEGKYQIGEGRVLPVEIPNQGEGCKTTCSRSKGDGRIVEDSQTGRGMIERKHA